MSGLVSSTKEILAYSQELFVNRVEERRLVTGIARQLVAGDTPDKRTVIFMGQRGMGKSWLLAQLYQELSQISQLKTVRLNLARFTGKAPEETVEKILHQMSQAALGRSLPTHLKPAKLSQELIQSIYSYIKEKNMALAVLVDSVYETEWDVLAYLEDYLLGSLAINSRVLVVMTGRGRPYPWKTPELRLKAEFRQLKLFKQEDTTDQLQRQQPTTVSRSAEIHEKSNGNPLANYLLATSPDSSEALDQTIEGVLEIVPNADARRQLRQHLEALSVLRAFDEERIPTMLAAYHNDTEKYKAWDYRDIRRVREEIVKWTFALWDDNQGAYVIDAFIRNLILRYLKDTKRDIWKRLQCTAYHLYQQWAIDYNLTEARWHQEAVYHQKELNEANIFTADCNEISAQAASTAATSAAIK